MRKAIAAFLAVLMMLSLTACGGGGGEEEDGVKQFTAFFAVPGAEINSDNEIQAKIAEITGAKCKLADGSDGFRGSGHLDCRQRVSRLHRRL